MSKSPDAFRTISEVAEWLGVQAHVLRFWESKFTQVKPIKRAGGRRYYRPADMLLLGGIRKLLHEDGLSIKDVQGILRDLGIAHVSEMSHSLDVESPQDQPAVQATHAPSPTVPGGEHREGTVAFFHQDDFETDSPDEPQPVPDNPSAAQSDGNTTDGTEEAPLQAEASEDEPSFAQDEPAEQSYENETAADETAPAADPAPEAQDDLSEDAPASDAPEQFMMDLGAPDPVQPDDSTSDASLMMEDPEADQPQDAAADDSFLSDEAAADAAPFAEAEEGVTTAEEDPLPQADHEISFADPTETEAPFASGADGLETDPQHDSTQQQEETMPRIIAVADEDLAAQVSLRPGLLAQLAHTTEIPPLAQAEIAACVAELRTWLEAH